MLKKIFVSSFALIALLSLNSCKKDSSSSSSSKSTWTLGSSSRTADITTTGTATLISDPNDGENYFISASASSGDDIASITFKDKPTVSKTYTVISSASALGTNANACIVGAVSGFSEFYTSTGKVGDVVTVTVSGGKITASFSNITVEEFSSSGQKTITGNLIEP